MDRYREVSRTEVKEGQEMPETSVVLHFLRHEEKEASKPGQPDKEVELTQKGRAKALATGKAKPAQTEVSWVGGSERIRSAHTALLRMAGGASKNVPSSEMDFATAKATVEEGMKVGEKVRHLPELNFYSGGTPGFDSKFMGEYKAGRGLAFFLNESDELARKNSDTQSLTYSRVAANYASLIAREMDAGNNFQRVAAKYPEKYQTYHNRLERYFGTHQTVNECFYMKALEKLHGREVVERFIESCKDKDGKANGFDFQEGFTIEIKNGPKGQTIMLEGVRGFPAMELTPQLLESIITDAKDLDDAIAKNQAAATVAAA